MHKRKKKKIKENIISSLAIASSFGGVHGFVVKSKYLTEGVGDHGSYLRKKPRAYLVSQRRGPEDLRDWQCQISVNEGTNQFIGVCLIKT